jgi:hypothetical protein
MLALRLASFTESGNLLRMQSPIPGQSLAETLAKSLPRYWDGKCCISELQQAGYHWRQMEWIGWWFEFRAMKELLAHGASVGPTYGSVTFDCALNGIWDFKAHPHKHSDTGYAYLNDQEAVDRCLEDHNHIGWIIAVGRAVYDETGQFKLWHEQLKGAESDYVREGRALGRRSRKRKSAFELTEIVWIEFRSGQSLSTAVQQGVLRTGLQAGQRNSDGSPRRPKYGISYARLRSYARTAGASFAAGTVRVS